MLIELWVSSSPVFKCPRVHPCQCGCIIHEDPLFPSGGFNFSTDGAHLCILYFPGLKVGQIKAKFFFFDFLVVLIVIPELCD
jgi:hypothetical protein